MGEVDFMNTDDLDNTGCFYEYLASASRQAIRIMIKEGMFTSAQIRRIKRSQDYERVREKLALPGRSYAYS
jgi:hypothetical protein